jgi:hypothetical protein
MIAPTDSPLLPHEDAQHDAAHPQHGQQRADGVDPPVAGVRDVVDELDAREHDGRLDPADGRPEVVDNGRDGDVHQRRVTTRTNIAIASRSPSSRFPVAS